MTARTPLSACLVLLALARTAYPQETTSYRVLSVTFNTLSPTGLAIDRGRLVWRDTDQNSGAFLLKYYTGGEIFTLDSNLVGVTSAIQGDEIAWSTAGGLVKSFDVRTWQTSLIGQSHNPDGAQPVSLSNALLAFSQRNAGVGTRIVLHNFAKSSDTLLSAGVWNGSPSVNQGELAWVASDSESSTTPSNIFFFDGHTSRNISATSGLRNTQPILRDAMVIWLQSDGVSSWVNLYTGDSVLTLARTQTANMAVTGYDVSDGIAVVAVQDSAAHNGTVTIFDVETGGTTVLADTNGPSKPRINNRLLAWQSGSGLSRKVMIYTVGVGLKAVYGGGESPVVGSDLVAWTSGDAVDLYAPATSQQLTTDATNGWEQTKFKTIDSARVAYGNFANAVHMRVFAWDGLNTTQLTDSSHATDFVMANDGYVIWRVDADSLYSYDGVHAPVKFLDTVQAENPYLAGGCVSFGGKRTAVAADTVRVWLYDIRSNRLTMITADSGLANGRVLCDRNTACWRSGRTGLLTFYDGLSISALGDSLVGNDYSYRNGKVVWIDRRNGMWEVMMYDVAAKTTSRLVSDLTPKVNPITDGSHVVWYENPVQVATTVTGDMRYYDMEKQLSWRVGHGTYRTTSWNSMSDGKIAWTPDENSVVAYDGNVLTQMMPYDGFRTYSGVYLDHDRIIWSRAIGSSTGANGDIAVQMLRPHVGFQADLVTGPTPLTVSFSNQSWEGDETYHWDFGDGSSSTGKNPVHTYTAPGAFTVTLAATGRTGSIDERKFRLIRTTSPAADVKDGPTLAWGIELVQNFPNPFNPSTTIRYLLARRTYVRLEIFNILGERIATLVNGEIGPGSHAIVFDASHLPSGVYVCRLAAGGIVATKKLLLVR